MTTNLIKINIFLFIISGATQFALLKYLISGNLASIVFKGEIVPNEFLVGASFNILLVGLILLYIFIRVRQHQETKPLHVALLEWITIGISSISILVFTPLLQIVSNPNGFKDQIDLPLNFKLRFDWPFSKRFNYLKDILKDQAIPEPADLELRARQTTSMDSIRDLAASMEKSHVEALRAKVAATKGPTIIDTGSSGIFDVIGGWVQGHPGEIAVGCIVICTIAFTVTIYAYLGVQASLKTVQGDLNALDQRATDLTCQQSAMPSKESFDAAVLNLDRRINSVSDATNFVNADLASLKEIANGPHIPNQTTTISDDTFNRFRESLLKIGEHSPSSKPYDSVEEALDSLGATVFSDYRAVTNLASEITEITETQSKLRSLVFKKFNFLNQKIGPIDSFAEILGKSNESPNEAQVSVYEVLFDLATKTAQSHRLATKSASQIIRNKDNISALKSKLAELTEQVRAAGVIDPAAATEQTAPVISAVLESGV